MSISQAATRNKAQNMYLQACASVQQPALCSVMDSLGREELCVDLSELRTEPQIESLVLALGKLGELKQVRRRREKRERNE